ncbi:RIP metalloprotease RseP [Baia soyae]|uniref:Zinc metalloprotease n=1 Tax=Baia soyae TaxID=1544746 RepID=A0A4V6NRU3_9BACL|nr:RIP metalloprotease RseP [Baia soyae]TCP70111.1 regulator of sigma E protease [Baia soyae]
MGNFLYYVAVFIPVLSLLVFIHELGHFLLAKRAGILVREFAIGFGSKIFSWRRGETLYSIRLLPLGGYVRMAGEEPETVEVKAGAHVYASLNELGKLDHMYLYEPNHSIGNIVAGRVVEVDLERKLYVVLENDEGNEARYELDPKMFLHFDEKSETQIAPWDRQFGSKTAGQKALAILAGPVFNIILTVVLFAIYIGITGVEHRLYVEKTVTGSPSATAGIQSGDIITKINGKDVPTFDMFKYQILESQGSEVKLTVDRSGQQLEIPLQPEKKVTQSGDVIYQVGIDFNSEKGKRPATIGEIVSGGFTLTYDWIKVIGDGFYKLFTFQLSLENLGGPIQMGTITGQAAQQGVDIVIKWMAILSLNLGLFNLLPIPALDGSRLLFIGIEALRGRPVSPNIESMVHFVGFALLMMLMLVVTYNDIVKLVFK